MTSTRTDIASAAKVTVWGATWRYGLAFLISALILSVTAPDLTPGYLLIDIVLGIVAFIALPFQRRWPLPVAVFVNACLVLSNAAVGPAMLATVSLAMRRRLKEIALVVVVGTAATLGYAQLDAGGNAPIVWPEVAFTFALNVALALFGMYVGSRRELVWSLSERARQAEEEQDLRVAAAQSAERERIAREMHDVLAHRISMISLHAGALSFREDLDHAHVRETAEVLRTSAHEALTDLRAVLGVLRSDGEPDRPQPTLRNLPGLVGDACEAGMKVALDERMPAAAQLPDSIGRTVYRIVQEGLTNAHKHAPGTEVKVKVSGIPGGVLDVTVQNPRPVGRTSDVPGSGLGLIGLRERADLVGGTLEVSKDAAGFVLRATIPWPEQA